MDYWLNSNSTYRRDPGDVMCLNTILKKGIRLLVKTLGQYLLP